jgi:hypothetical protein
VDAGLTGDRLAERALEACERAGVEVVVFGADPEPVARELDLRAWIEDAALTLDGETFPDDPGPAAAVARHLRARACEPADALGVGEGLAIAPAVGAYWLTPAPDDPLRSIELARHPNVRVAEAGGGAAFYEAVVTTLMERRA